MKDATCVSGDGYKDLCQEVARESLEADVGAENIIKQGLMSWDGRLLFNVLDMLKKVDPATPRGDHLRRTQKKKGKTKMKCAECYAAGAKPKVVPGRTGAHNQRKEYLLAVVC